MDRSHLSQILKSPLYVRADKDVYQYLLSKGYDVIDGVEAFSGLYGCFRHERADGSEYIKVGYHEGIVDSGTWLAVQDKKSRNRRIPSNNTAKNSRLTGLAKCGHCGHCGYCGYCGYALSLQYRWNVSKTYQWRYFGDQGAHKANGCVKKRLDLRPDDVEKLVFEAMIERLESLIIAKTEKKKPNAETESIKAEIIRLDEEINALMDKLAKSDDTLFGYIQDRIRVIHNKKSDLDERLRTKTRKHKEIDTAPLEEPLSRWDELSIEEKHALAVTMIDVVYVTDENGVDIRFCM